jgi:hypothetical protein
MEMQIEVYKFPSHSERAEQAYGVKVDGALIGLVERYLDGSWHMGGGRYRKLGWLSYPTRSEVVKIMVDAEQEKDMEEEPETEIFLEKDGVIVWRAYETDRRLEYHFALSQEAAEGGAGTVFDVRELSGYETGLNSGKANDDLAREVIEQAIERGELGNLAQMVG